MAEIKGTITVLFKLDTEDYHVPVDGRLSLSLSDDIQEALETNLPLEIQNIKITGIKKEFDAEIRDQD